MLKGKPFLYILFITLALLSCAKRGSITGGLKDTIPPVIVGSSPRNMSTNFNGNKIHIDFNEYIKIKDANKQLIISPPLDYPPNIVPSGSASRFIDITIRDTLKPNTTYSFNFGQSITDNNEGNPYSQFKFVFSTGSYIDSLAMSGSIKDAHEIGVDNFVTIMLYEGNETFNDSTIYKTKPRYVTNTLDSMVNFSLQNLKEGKYHLFALKDANNNYVYNPKVDKIAFLNRPITVPNDSTYELNLFKEKGVYRALKPTLATANRLYVPYEGKDPRGITATVNNGSGNETYKTLVTNVPGKDSVQIWLPRAIKADSLQVTMAKNDSLKKFMVRYKELKESDSLSVEAVQKGGLHFRETFTLRPSTPLTDINKSRMFLVDKDSVGVPFTHKYDDFNQSLELDFVKEENQKYTFTLLPGALTDFYGQANDTLSYKLNTRSYDVYGNMVVKIQNVKRFPVIVELTDAKGKLYTSAYSEGETDIEFANIEPNNYLLRIIYDDNKNREWDTGDYRTQRQPEEVIYFPKEIPVLEQWDVEETFPVTK
jgi:uncharacterized protein (DUF2141 family)